MMGSIQERHLMATQVNDAEIRALQVLLEALEPLDEDARNRVLDYTLKRLGMREISAPSVTESHFRSDDAGDSRGGGQITDIRSLREAKQPATAIEMTAIVAYYLAEAAPEAERKEAVTTADVEKYFKQANYRLPTRMDKVLNNAAAAGYFDRSARGAYRLNPVGFNLVTQTLPRAQGAPARTGARAPRSRTGRANAPRKTTK